MRLCPFVAVLLALSLMTSAASAQIGPEASVTTFANPLDLQGADPDVLLDGGTYYLYSTSAANTGFLVWSSTDLVHWRRRGLAFRKSETSWAQKDFWAPCVIKSGQRYLLYYNAQPADAPADSARAHRICVAQSASPIGPFTDVAAPLWDPGDMVIDAQVFVDSDGRGYLYYANGSVWGVPLDRSLTKIAGEPVRCLEPNREWEQKWNEGPYVMRHGGKYVMFYSGPGYDMPEYSVGYALADAPLGPWVKPMGVPILRRTPWVSGPGHNSVAPSPDGRELFMVYHTHEQLAGGAPRQIAIDRMRFTDDPYFGLRVEVDGPTTLAQRLPSGASGLRAAASDEFDSSSLDRARWTIVNEDTSGWRLAGGKLMISTFDGTAAGTRYDLRNLFLQAPPPGDFEVETRAELSVRQNPQQAYITVWCDHNNYVRLANSYGLNTRVWQVTRELGGEPYVFEAPNTLGDEVWMKIARHGRTYQCSVSVNGERWWPVGPPLAADFPEVKIGLGAASPGGTRKAEGSFDFFRVSTGGAILGPQIGAPAAPRR
ncbi:MAG TPA: family 43 glycosylhydrolase [Phycisphaerales bacterium]|nr:family 43 glycosylhydrolase [Phycisphaerales bacterium]